MTRVVSVTQNAIERDSRAYKVASSLTRFGYESIAIETEPSSLDRAALPFELLTLGESTPAEPPSSSADREPTDTPAPEPSPSLPLRLAMRLFAFLPERARDNLRPRLADVLDRAVGLLEPVYVAISVGRSNLHILRAMPPADLYYMHYFGHYPAAYLLAKRHRARLVYDAHDANFDPDPALLASFRNPGTMRLLKSIDRRFSRGAATFMTVSDGVAALFERSYGRRPKVVRNYHEFRMDRDSPADVRSAAGVPDDAFLLVMTGATKPGDTVEEGLEALARLPADVHLALVGKGHEQQDELIASHGLSGRVHAIQPVPPTEVASFIRTADASPILYMAFSENYRQALPNRFFHAVAAGLPILYPSTLPEIASRCERFEMGIPIEPTEPDSIEAGLRRLLDDPELVSRLGANARAAHEELSWEHEERALARIIEGTLDGRAT